MKKNKNTSLFILALAGLIPALAGCVTPAYHEHRYFSSRPMKEFAPMQGETPELSHRSDILYRGRYGGQTEADGKRFHLAQFDGILAGKGRYLSLHLPAGFFSGNHGETGVNPRLFETEELQQGPANAYLICSIHRGLLKKLWKPMNDLGKNKAAGLDPYVLLKEQFNYRPLREEYPVVVAVLDKSCPDHDQFYFYYFIWEKGPGKPAITAFKFDRLTYDEGMKEIRWVRRNRALYNAGYMVYPLCVVADVALLPAYILFLPAVISYAFNLSKLKS